MEQDRLLLDDRDLLAQRRLRHRCDVLTIDPDLAGLQVMQTLDQLDEGRLART
ncbi:hypothetical protein D3C71_2234120 [compost metagenome]